MKKHLVIIYAFLFFSSCISDSNQETQPTPNPTIHPTDTTAIKKPLIQQKLGDTLFSHFRSGMTKWECDSILDKYFEVGKKNKHFYLGNIDFKIKLTYFDKTLHTIQLVNNSIENYLQYDSVCKMFFDKYHVAEIKTSKKDRKMVYNYQEFILTDESASCQLTIENRRIDLSYFIKNSAKGPSLHNPLPIKRELLIVYVDLINDAKFSKFKKKNTHKINPTPKKGIDKI